ncbi:MAG: CDP-alcohol phosphatidyltransferase family protein [Actinocatenispora sp.]
MAGGGGQRGDGPEGTDPAASTPGVDAAIIVAPDPPAHAAPPLLRRLGGRTLLDRAVTVLRQAGVRRVLLAAGPVSGAAIGGEVRRRGLAVTPHPPATTLPAGRYLLVAGDQVFDTVSIHRLIRETDGALVATDADLAVLDATAAGDMLAAAEYHTRLRDLPTGPPRPARVLADGFTAAAADEAGARRAERALWHRYGPKTTDGLICTYLNRPLSRPVTLALLRTGLSPDVLTVLSFLVTVAGAVGLAAGADGRWWTVLLGGLLVQAGSVLDGIDGEVARISLRASPRGALLDTILDRYADLAVVAGLVLAAGGAASDWAWGFAAAAASMLISYVNALVPTAPRRLLRRDVRLLVCAVGGVALVPWWALVVLAVVGNLDVARVFWSVIRRAAGPT